VSKHTNIFRPDIDDLKYDCNPINYPAIKFEWKRIMKKPLPNTVEESHTMIGKLWNVLKGAWKIVQERENTYLKQEEKIKKLYHKQKQ
jgi:hypothetical protein